METATIKEQRQKLLGVLRGLGVDVAGITNNELDGLWREGYRTFQALENASREDLVEAGLPRGIVSCIHPSQRNTTNATSGPGKPAPERFTRFWHALLNLEIKSDSFLELPSDTYLMGQRRMGNALLVRSCYRALFDRMMDLRDRPNDNYSRFLITGTPGIGKSHFAVVLMGWLMREKKVRKIVYEIYDERYLLTPDGVRWGTLQDFAYELVMDPDAWWIVDMGTANNAEPQNTVLLASPDRKRYNEFLKLPGTTTLYMPIWTDEEIEACRSRLFPLLDASTVQTLTSLWGNIPRYVLEKANDTVTQQLLDDTIENCTWQEVIQCIGKPDSAKESSHKLLHLEVVGDHYDRKVMRPASPYVVRRLEERAGKAHVGHLEELVHLSMGSPAYAAAAGAFFENYAHHFLQEGGTFDVRQLSSSSQIDQGHQGVTKLSLQRPASIYVFSNLAEVKQQASGVYCMPRIHNFPAVDAIMRPGSLFQMTVAQKDGMNSKGLEAAVAALQGKSRRLYFVVPCGISKSFKMVAGIPETIPIEQWVLEVPWKR